MLKIFAVLVLALGLVACDKDRVPPSDGGRDGGGPPPIVPRTFPQPGPAPVAPAPDVKPPVPKDTDVTCTGIYGTKPYHLIFKADGKCWFQDTHGPDRCHFEMDKKRVQLTVTGGGTIGGRFEDDCSAVSFGGQTWTRSGPVPADK